MAPTLLVLAAGMGSRYGGLKQIDPVGPSGEALLDYAVFDAIRAGFGRVVFVIRREFEDAFRSSVASKFSGRIAFECVFQSTDDLPGGCAVPAGRERPWGTGHAVWCARAALDGPFAAINADDFYGAGSFSRLRGFLEGARGPRFALVGFRLADTLSEGGTVSRGVCRQRDGLLLSISEERAIGRTDMGPGGRFSGEGVPGRERCRPRGGVLPAGGRFRACPGRRRVRRGPSGRGRVVRHHPSRRPGARGGGDRRPCPPGRIPLAAFRLRAPAEVSPGFARAGASRPRSGAR